eukprot:1133524-Pelagomonas_calceolata.AAC.1
MGSQGQGAQDACCHPLGHLLHGGLQAVVRQEVQGHKAIAHIRALLGHAHSAGHITLANLHKAATHMEERSSSRHHAWAGQGVEHHMHPTTVGCCQLLHKGSAA